MKMVIYYITQGMNNITPFEKLNILAILECYYRLHGEEVVIIRYGLACYAARTYHHHDSTLPKNGSSLLNFDKHS